MVKKNMRGSCGAGEAEQIVRNALRLKSFLAKTFRGFTTTASGSKFSDGSWDKMYTAIALAAYDLAMVELLLIYIERCKGVR